MRMLPILLIASACAAGPASEADLSSEIAGRSAPPPEECVPASSGANLVARDTRTLVYHHGDTLWVNRLAAACPGLDPMGQIVIQVHGSRYCRGDSFRTRRTGETIPGPICVLGSFTPYRR
jgi:hypothetical protein